MIDTDDKPHLSIVPYMELSFDEICELDEDVARQGVWNLREEVKRLREALINVQRSLVWDEKDRAMFDEPITLEALFTQVEQVRSDITEMIE